MAAALVVDANGLEKSYGTLKALDAVSFQVRPGEIFGFIGADGAGKTTAFRIIGGVLEAGGGEVHVLETTPRDARPRVGYLTQPFSLYQDMSVDENLNYAGGLREVPKEDFEERRERYFKLFELIKFTDRLAGRLSGGMKQKLALSCALIADPALLLLDEPTTGVDPVTRRDFWDALTSLATGGMSIIVATPYLDEAERCHRVALMERGKIYDIDSPVQFRAKMGVTRLEVKVQPLAGAEDVLSKSPQVEDVQRFGDRLDVMAPDPDAAEVDLHQRAANAGLQITEIRRSLPTLENAFVGQLRKMRGAQVVPPFPKPSPPVKEKDVVIGAKDLNKRFGNFQAVKNFQLEIRNGEIYGLLGANGAGKTTSIKIICGLIEPTSGSVTLLGKSKGLRSPEVRSRIGYMSQKFALYDDLTIGENLDFYARLYGVDESVREERKTWVLETAELRNEAGMLTKELPGGWKQRVAFGAAVMHEPDAIFLDEPTSGVDPLARRAMWRMINAFADRGAGVLVVTHYLEEAEQCNQLGFMVAGEIIDYGSPSEVKGRMKGTLYEFEVDRPDLALTELKKKFGASRVSLFGDRLHLVVHTPEEKGQAVALLREVGVGVLTEKEVPFSLEDVFIALIESRRSEIPL
ncbi:MAG TPA: ATP-binding cassette domain-containing protein [Candidatus Acidoferrales bacterium]|nr:ATP-binding cassette domain-containing protein [Candidatus Acidoferrales bacterium]